MLINNNFKNAIAKVFYDKTVYKMAKDTTIDAEGGITVKGLKVIDEFKGNVSFSNCKSIQENFGIDYNIDITVTTNKSDISIDDILKYQDIIYKVTDVLVMDSHFLILATKWRQ